MLSRTHSTPDRTSRCSCDAGTRAGPASVPTSERLLALPALHSMVQLWRQFVELEPEVPPADTCAKGQRCVSYKCKRCLAVGVTQLLGETGCWEGQGEGQGQCPM